MRTFTAVLAVVVLTLLVGCRITTKDALTIAQKGGNTSPYSPPAIRDYRYGVVLQAPTTIVEGLYSVVFDDDGKGMWAVTSQTDLKVGESIKVFLVVSNDPEYSATARQSLWAMRYIATPEKVQPEAPIPH